MKQIGPKQYTDIGTGEQLPSTDPRTLDTKAARIAAAAAEQAAFEASFTKKNKPA